MAAIPSFLAIEIGGTKLQLALGPGDGTISMLERRVIRPEAGAAGLLDQIAEAYQSLIRSGVAPVAIGIGFGGPVDAERGLVVKSHQVEGWDGFDLADWARRNLGVSKVSIQNDADTAGYGEARFGAGRGLSPIFYVTIGSGIGGGLVINGQIYRGSGLGAAEIGHLWIDDPIIGARRLEDIASGWAIGRTGREGFVRAERTGILETLAKGDPSAVDVPLVAEAARQGDPRAQTILATATRSLGRALAQVVTLLGPRRVILGGGVSLLGEDRWFQPIREELDSRVFEPFRGAFDVVPAELGEAVVLHGALGLARDLHERQPE